MLKIYFIRHFNRSILIAILLLAFAATSCNQANNPGEKEKDLNEKNEDSLKKEQDASQKADTLVTKLPGNNKDSGNLDFLKEFEGKYPNDVKMFDNHILNMRLQKLLGNRYAFLKETWAVETPIKIKDNIFVASGCEQHNCDQTNFIIVADLSKNILYAGVREEKKVKLYAEDGGSNQELTDWANDN